MQNNGEVPLMIENWSNVVIVSTIAPVNLVVIFLAYGLERSSKFTSDMCKNGSFYRFGFGT